MIQPLAKLLTYSCVICCSARLVSPSDCAAAWLLMLTCLPLCSRAAAELHLRIFPAICISALAAADWRHVVFVQCTTRESRCGGTLSPMPVV